MALGLDEFESSKRDEFLDIQERQMSDKSINRRQIYGASLRHDGVSLRYVCASPIWLKGLMWSVVDWNGVWGAEYAT